MMGDVDKARARRPDDLVYCCKHRLSVGKVKTLARFVEDQQTWRFHNRAGKEHQALVPERERP